MGKLTILLTSLLVLALIFAAIGCGDDEEPTATPTQTQVAETPTPSDVTPTPGYTGGEHTFKVAHINPITHLTHKQWEYFDERLRYYTDGQVKLEIFPMSSLYSSFEMWDALATGALDLAALFDFQLQMAGFVDYQITWLNFFWGDTMEEAQEHGERFFNHPDGGPKLFALTEPGGVKTLAAMPGTSIQILLNDLDIKSLHGMKDKKIPSVGGLGALFVEYAGGKQVMIDPSEFAVSFQQGLVDVMGWGPANVYNSKLYEDACCGIVFDALFVNQFISFNLDLWNSLSQELQDIIQNKVIPEVLEWTAITEPELTGKAIQDLEDVGMTIYYMTPEERREFRDGTWELAKNTGMIDQMDPELLKLADQLRTEPYDQGYFYP